MILNFIKIDDEGYLLSDQGARLTDESMGLTFFSNLKMDEKFTLHSTLGKQAVVVEAYDEPIMVRSVELKGGSLVGTAAYGYKAQLNLNSLSLDEWDRFHGLTMSGVPFAFTRAAQIQFFDVLEQFDDESVQILGTTYPTPPWLTTNPRVNDPEFWTEIYKTETMGWELGEPAVALKDILPQLKMAKARVLVLGCGSGHDAAFFADHGHMVTGVDVSPEAISRAEANYGGKENLKFVQADVFELDKSFGPFDVIFEHTCYCAIDPNRRNELVKVWRNLLAERGHLLGVFFTMSKREGPPYGGSEFELKQRLSPNFNFLYWTRWRHSLPRRMGKELVVYAQKK